MNRFKVAIVTFHSAQSYGAFLQCIALKSYLETCNCTVEIVNYNKLFKLGLPTGIWTLRKTYNLTNLRSYFMFKMYRRLYMDLGPEIKKKSATPEIFKDYNLVLTGSDQVWNVKITKGEKLFYFLDNFSKIEKASYAASFGNDNWDYNSDDMELIRSNLAGFKSISVREITGQSILKENFNLNSEVVVDPTLLLDREFYLKHFQLTNLIKSPEIVFFKLGYDGDFDEQLLLIQAKLNFNTLILNGKSSVNGINHIRVPSVKEWLNSFFNSKLVITDSFHGLAFCLIFQKQFVIINANKKRFNRISNLLDNVGLANRVLIENNAEEVLNLYKNPIDYAEVGEILSPLVSNSKSYLRRLIN